MVETNFSMADGYVTQKSISQMSRKNNNFDIRDDFGEFVRCWLVMLYEVVTSAPPWVEILLIDDIGGQVDDQD